MTKDQLKKLYDKEREYQRKVFGDYELNPTLNVASFLILIERYLIKAQKAYSSKWEPTGEPGLVSCKEQRMVGNAPFDTYSELVKLFALAGAALEIYLDVNVDEWRVDGINQKWFEEM